MGAGLAGKGSGIQARIRPTSLPPSLHAALANLLAAQSPHSFTDTRSTRPLQLQGTDRFDSSRPIEFGTPKPSPHGRTGPQIWST